MNENEEGVDGLFIPDGVGAVQGLASADFVRPQTIPRRAQSLEDSSDLHPVPGGADLLCHGTVRAGPHRHTAAAPR